MQLLRSSLKFKLFFAIFLPTLLLVLAIYPMYQSSENVSRLHKQLAASHEAISAVRYVSNQMLAAESSLRGYLLGQDKNLLQPYDYAALEVPATINRILAT